MFGNLFKPRSHYVFDYKPRYYNERKERLQKLKEKYHGNKEKANEVPTINISKNNLKKDWIRAKRNATDKATNLRLAIIIAVLIGIVAYILEIHTLF